MSFVACHPSPVRYLEVSDNIVCSGMNVEAQDAKWPFNYVPEEKKVDSEGQRMCLHLYIYPKVLEV